jgi:hypothetical protein
MQNTSSGRCLETRLQLRLFQTGTTQNAVSVFGKALRHIAMATVGLTLGVSQLTAAAISPIPNSQLNGSAQLVNGAIQITNGTANETGTGKTRAARLILSSRFISSCSMLG